MLHRMFIKKSVQRIKTSTFTYILILECFEKQTQDQNAFREETSVGLELSGNLCLNINDIIKIVKLLKTSLLSTTMLH